MRGLDTLTHTQDDYRNPRCACAPRVNYWTFRTPGVGYSEESNYSRLSCHNTDCVYIMLRMDSKPEPRYKAVQTVSKRSSLFYSHPDGFGVVQSSLKPSGSRLGL